jgi:hypothetical protein
MLLSVGLAGTALGQQAQTPSPVVVCNVKVLSDKVPDISSIEAWKKSFINDSMSEKEKGLAVWKSVVTFQHQETPPNEYLQNEENVLDPIKLFNVYGYSLCSVAAGELIGLARYAGLDARGWTINAHCVSEVKWNDSWHLLDASLINYFPKKDGEIASVAEISKAVQDFLKEHPDLKGNDKKLREWGWRDQKTAWKNGPELLSTCPFYNARGWWPAGTHGWYSTMQEYDGSNKTPFDFISLVALGYRVNVQLRDGEVLTRNWSNKGLHINMDGSGGVPGCMTMQTGKDSLQYTPDYGDIAPGRVGNGRLKYQPTMASLRDSAMTFEDLAVKGEAITLADAAQKGALVVRMPSSYVYLGGELTIKTTVAGGSISILCSDNNGMDWKPVTKITTSGEQKIDLKSLVYRRYDYRLKFEFAGAGTSLGSLRIDHDIQHSQRPLPALAQGANTITFSAGDPTATVTVEGSPNLAFKGKQLLYTDFHPVLDKISGNMAVEGALGSATFPVQTPGEMTKLRIGCAYRSWVPEDGIDIEVSFDGGKTFKVASAFGKSDSYANRYVEVTDIPAGTTAAQVRYVAKVKSAIQWYNFHINADYRQPNAGFRPVKVTYAWDENGQAKTDVHVAQKPEETYKINCQGKPMMKSISLELAK